MSQSNYNIPNQSAPAVRAQLNSVFGSIATNNSGSAAPSTTFAHQWWYDTTTNILKQRNAANSAWIDTGTFDQTGGTFTPTGQRDLASQAEAEAGTDNTKIMTPLRTAEATAAPIAALAAGDAGAPVVAAGWHPYNMANVGDGQTGLIYSFPVNGALSEITSPDFEDGYEYAFWIDQIRGTSLGQDFRINLYRETSNAYAGFQDTGVDVSNSSSVSGWVEIPRARRTLRNHFHYNLLAVDSSNSINLINYDVFIVRHGTAQKILRAKFAAGFGNLTGSGSTGQIYMHRRRDLS